MILLVTGGSGCGKSTWAERVMAAREHEKRYYIATMQVYDEESRRRVARHRAQRAQGGYETIECPMDLASAQVAPGAGVLLECLPNLVANEMFSGGDPARIFPAIQTLAQACGDLVIVTNDVFSDGESYSPEVQEYMRQLAWLNGQAAQLADCVAEVVYSIPVALKGELPCVDGMR